MDTADEAISKPLLSTKIKEIFPTIQLWASLEFGKFEQILYCIYHSLGEQISNENAKTRACELSNTSVHAKIKNGEGEKLKI